MQLFEMSWQPAKPGVNQHCQSATTASKRERGRKRGRGCVYVYVYVINIQIVRECRKTGPMSEKKNEG